MCYSFSLHSLRGSAAGTLAHVNGSDTCATLGMMRESGRVMSPVPVVVSASVVSSADLP